MFCTKCGKKLDSSAKFCSGCGNPVSDPVAVEEKAPEVSAPETPAPVAVEEKAPEESAPETPAPVAVEEKAPETSVPETPASVVVEEKTPETSAPETPAPVAEEKAPEESSPEAPTPAAVEEKAPEAPAPVAVEEKTPETSAPETPAPVAVEEKAPEINAPEAPAPVAVEEKAPETSAPETPAPVTVEEKGSEAAGGASQSPLPAPSFSEFAAENPAPKKKKKKVGPIIGIGAAAVVIGGAAVGYFCFHNQVMRLFMGDAGFAVSVEIKTGGFFGADDPDAADEAVAAYLGQLAESANPANSESDEKLAVFSSLLPMAEKLDGSEITYGMSLEANELLRAFLSMSDQADVLFGMFGDFRGILRVTDGEDCDRFESVIEYGGERLFGSDLYSDGETVAITAPDLTDCVFYGKLPREEPSEKPASLSPEEVGRIRTMIMKLYYEAFSDAEITYTDGEFEVAGQTVSGTRIEVSLTAEQTNALYARIKEALKNDEAIRGLYQIDDEEYNELFDKDETTFSSFCAVSYIDDRAALLAKSYAVGTEEGVGSLTLLRSDDEAHFRLETPEGERCAVDTLDSANEGTDGSLEISYSNAKDGEDAPTLVLVLDYANVGETEYLGQAVRLGTFTVRISEKDTMIRSLLTGSGFGDSDYYYVYDETAADLSAGKNMMGVSSQQSAIFAEMLQNATFTFTVSEIGGDDGAAAIRSEWALRFGEYLGISAYLEMKPFERTEPPVMPPLDGGKSLDLNEEPSEEFSNQLRIDLYEGLIKMMEENKAFGKLAERLEIKKDIENALARERAKVELLRHYADYSDYKQYRADSVARYLASEFESEYWNEILTLNADGSALNEAWGTEEFTRTVKLYFDGEGELTVLDDGGLGFLFYDELEKDSDRKNLYCEILFSTYGDKQPNGVTVVYTDDPNDLPDGLPTVYNYLDGVYEWNGRDNAKDGFIVGTSPWLTEGVTTAEERLRLEREEREKEAEEIGALNDAAKRINSAVSSFLSANPSFFRSDVQLASIIVKYDVNRGWIVESFTGNDGKTANQSTLFTEGVPAVGKLTDHLNRLFPDFEPVTAQVHFVRGGGNNSGMSGGGTAPTSLGAMTVIGTGAIKNGTGSFQENIFSNPLSFWTGYEPDWTGKNPSAEPIAGVYWTSSNKYVLLGSYCAETNAPLSTEPYEISGAILESEVETLNDYARRISKTASAYFTEQGALGGSNEDTPLFSITLTHLGGGEWQFTDARVNNYSLPNSDEVIDREVLNGLVDLLELLSWSGSLGIAREVKAELHFLHGEFVGAGVLFLDENSDFSDTHIPGAWDFSNGYFYDWNARNRNAELRPGIYYADAQTAVPFGSYCVSTDAPLGLYPENSEE